MLKQFPWQILRCYSSTFTMKTCTFSQTPKQWGEMKNRKSSSDSSVNGQQESAVSSALHASKPQWAGCLVICVSLLTIDGIASLFFKKRRYFGLEKICGAVLPSADFRLARANLVQDETQPSYKNVTGRFIVPRALQTRQSTSYICDIHSFPFIWLFISLSPSLRLILCSVSAEREGQKEICFHPSPLARTRA